MSHGVKVVVDAALLVVSTDGVTTSVLSVTATSTLVYPILNAKWLAPSRRISTKEIAERIFFFDFLVDSGVVFFVVIMIVCLLVFMDVGQTNTKSFLPRLISKQK